MKFISLYNPDWVSRYAMISSWLEQWLHADCHLHHVGSTSIPGMPAKDIIDIEIECPPGDMSLVIASLKAAGYEHQGTLGIEGREAFRPLTGTDASRLPVHHLYACESGAFELLKQLAFKHYLLSNPERAAWLAQQKIECDQSARSREGYIERKAPFYAAITAEALKWAGMNG